ncbi:radical SAM protein, partial [Rhizobium ruizarguesonis]
MREQYLAGQAAFAPANTADIADAMIVSSGLRVEVDRRRGRGAGLNPKGRFEALQRETVDDGWQTWEE